MIRLFPWASPFGNHTPVVRAVHCGHFDLGLLMAGTIAGNRAQIEVSSFQSREAWADAVIADPPHPMSELLDPDALYFITFHSPYGQITSSALCRLTAPISSAHFRSTRHPFMKLGLFLVRPGGRPSIADMQPSFSPAFAAFLSALLADYPWPQPTSSDRTSRNSLYRCWPCCLRS